MVVAAAATAAATTDTSAAVIAAVIGMATVVVATRTGMFLLRWLFSLIFIPSQACLQRLLLVLNIEVHRHGLVLHTSMSRVLHD